MWFWKTKILTGLINGLFTLLFTLPAFGQSPADGTFDVVSVESPEACAKLCREAELCRGHTTLTTIINDIPQPTLECRLNNGLGENSPFKFPTPPPVDLDRAVNDLNTYRAQYNLSPVKLNLKLVQASKVHSEDLAQTGTNSHTGSDGSTPADRTERQQYNYSFIAENVATGQKDWPAAFIAWQNSPGHNENLLHPLAKEFGVALKFNPKSSYGTYWTMLVGDRL